MEMHVVKRNKLAGTVNTVCCIALSLIKSIEAICVDSLFAVYQLNQSEQF